jgi:hypothetical protein
MNAQIAKALSFSLALITCGTIEAQVRTSANYSITTEVADSGGTRATSAAYSNIGSSGGVTGVSTVALPVEVAKQGYIGQLFEIVGFSVSATQNFVNEGATLQLSGGQLLDDATTLAVNASLVSWSVVSGPLASINANGLATAQIVYQDSGAVIQGVYQATTGQFPLTVRNVNIDDFQTYAGDGIDDVWQVQYFGVNNPNAGPNVDFDGTGQSNLFKYVAGLNPLDPTSRFTVQSQPVNAQPLQKNILFQPLVTGRVYVVQYNTSIASGGGTWTTLTNISSIDNGSVRTVTDLNASDPERFYRVQITKP